RRHGHPLVPCPGAWLLGGGAGRPRPGRARPQRRGVGRGRRLLGRVAAGARELRDAVGVVPALPVLRHRQAAADPSNRPRMAGARRRAGRRPARSRLHGAGDRLLDALRMTAHGIMDDGDALVALAAALGRSMRDAGGLIVTAESCTGGLIAQVLTETAGSSEWFDRGFVTYSNEAKADLLGVRPATLQSQGAVSEAVAREMASGALKRSAARLALSVTGIAGPGG